MKSNQYYGSTKVWCVVHSSNFYMYILAGPKDRTTAVSLERDISSLKTASVRSFLVLRCHQWMSRWDSSQLHLCVSLL